MTLFFLVVGLEIKRELVAGELATWRRAALPVVAAAGGMAVPAAIYAAANAGGPAPRLGSTDGLSDIAFALGVLALLGSRVPAALKVFLLTLAVVDDLGSIAVVALFYSRGVELGTLAVAAGLLVLVAVLVRAGVWWLPLHVGLGLALWLALWHSGVSPALAGVAMGLLTPARPTAPPEVARDVGGAAGRRAGRRPAPAAPAPAGCCPRPGGRCRGRAPGPRPAPGQRVRGGAAVRAGQRRDLAGTGGAGRDRGGAVLGGVLAGRVLGKLAGITAAAWLAVRLGLAARPGGPAGPSWPGWPPWPGSASPCRCSWPTWPSRTAASRPR